MELINIINNTLPAEGDNLEVVGTINCFGGLTTEEAIELLGGEIINDENDDRFSSDGDNVIINGKRYWYECLYLD